MLKNIALYLMLIKLKFKGMRSYKTAFLISAISLVTFNIVGFVLVWIMINSFGSIGDWQPYEVIFLYALNLGAFGIASCFFQGASLNLPTMIQTGDFDQFLVKPLDTFIYYFSSFFGYTQVPHLLLAIGVICISCKKLDIEFSLKNILVLIIILVSGAVIQGAIYIIAAIPSFWLVQNNGLIQIALSFRSFIRFPISAYSRAVQMILTFVIPYGFVNFYPSQLFLNKQDYLIFNRYIVLFSPAVAIIWMALAILLWCFGIKHYQSTGS